MSTVDMNLVKQLRVKTQVSLMECKKALEETGGNLDAAVDLLRKRGAAVAAKRAGNETSQGRVASFVSENEKSGALAQLACETDFSANTQDMQNFAEKIAQHSAKSKETDITSLMNLPLGNAGLKAQDHLDELIAKISESIKVTQAAQFEISGPGLVHTYIHPGAHVGTMVSITADQEFSDANAVRQAARDICMQIAVTKPQCISPDELDTTEVEKERAIVQEQLAQSGKPANVIEKIVEGKLNKHYQEVCLNYQPFIKDDKMSVSKYLESVSKKVGSNLKVTQFVRFAVGNK